MKTSFDFELAASERPPSRYMPSGIHRIGRSADVGRESTTASADMAPSSAGHDDTAPRISPVSAARSSLPPLWSEPANTPRLRAIAPTHLALALSVTALVGRWFVDSGWGCALISLTPLILLMRREPRTTWSLYAGMLWLALAFVERVHPVAALAAPWQGVLSLTVLAFVLLSLGHTYKSVQELSRRDPLTGLLNRRGFEELGLAELRRAARYERPIAFALLDVDRFKQINDRHGHALGDRVLQLVAAQLGELRNSDLAVRLGGDEFGLLMPETDAAGAEVLIARLRQRVEDNAQEFGVPVTLSVGIADNQTRGRLTRMDALVAEADRRMYEVKATKHPRAQ